MATIRKCSSWAVLVSAGLVFLRAAESRIPAFGRDTVLVWKTENQDFASDFVVRLAEFAPDRFMEWEDSSTQGTIFIPSKDLEEARGYVSAQMFQSGIDARGKNVTTLWLSRRIFLDLK